MISEIVTVCLTILGIAGLVYLTIQAKAKQKEQMTKDICNTVEKIVIAVKGK